MSELTLPKAIPAVEGATPRLVVTTAYYRAESWDAMSALQRSHGDAPSYYAYFDSDTGQLNHIGWKEGDLTVSVWAPEVEAA